jgi:hypothetical protein
MPQVLEAPIFSSLPSPLKPALPSPQWTRGARVVQTVDPQAIQPWEKEAKEILREFLAHQLSWPFKEPLDFVKLGIPDYPNIIKQPMDLGTVNHRLKKRLYSNPQGFIADMRLIWANSMTYDSPSTDIYKWAESLSEIFETHAVKLIKVNTRDDLKRAREIVNKLDSERRLIEEEEKRLQSEISALEEPSEFDNDEIVTAAHILCVLGLFLLRIALSHIVLLELEQAVIDEALNFSYFFLLEIVILENNRKMSRRLNHSRALPSDTNIFTLRTVKKPSFANDRDAYGWFSLVLSLLEPS